ncbi:unnamed protein product [Cylindrotheca closterium]|uniref:Glycoside hydrolase family 38 central domain-containing protein n=1 Tax=Cylindrotheca closterium TaxID=2856 RepID=A0AAD2CTI8_9STRA|nr:unnamed protein product [Cylindrotheca closterium]
MNAVVRSRQATLRSKTNSPSSFQPPEIAPTNGFQRLPPQRHRKRSRQQKQQYQNQDRCDVILRYTAYVLLFLILVAAWLVGFLLVGGSSSSLLEKKKLRSRILHSNLGSLFHPEPPRPAGPPVQRYYFGKTRPHERPEPKYLVNDEEHPFIDMRDLNLKLPFDNPDGGTWSQGWDLEPVSISENRPLQVFVVPHSHCDPGWLKTFDEYYQSQTKHILDTIMESLQQDQRRKFIWAEISFFEKWWNEQSADIQDTVRMLLRNKQFEFVTGGWVQPDEANTDLYAMEVQLQEGHDFIRETFGEEYIPKYGWSIDPFGFSPTMAYLLKKYGFKGMLIQRVHYAVKKELALHRQLEFLWRQTWDDEGEYDMFTHMMPFFSYDVPHSCGPDPEVCCAFDFARLPELNRDKYKPRKCAWGTQPEVITEANVKEKALSLLDQYRKKASLFRSTAIIAPLGDDFRFDTTAEAQAQFENLQHIFDYLNENFPGVSVQFGTLSEYFDVVIGTFDPPILKGSFFTYADQNEDYWSGYFTSRPFDKALGRRLERALYAASAMGATKEEMRDARRAMSLFQHHDAITGTATDKVMEDYATRMQKALKDVEQWMMNHIDLEELGHRNNLSPCNHYHDTRSPSSSTCQDGDRVVVYNPLDKQQRCGNVIVEAKESSAATYPCEASGSSEGSNTEFEFDPRTGLMIKPLNERWMIWNVEKGGSYLFFPERSSAYHRIDTRIENGGFVVTTNDWNRTIIERNCQTFDGKDATVIDFVFETNLSKDNQEWLVRFSTDIENKGIFHTDLNGFTFDTHYHRTDLPVQAQVYPMPMLASIEDYKQRFTVLSEHAQGAASLKEGTIDVWLDRRLKQDDGRGLGQGVTDNLPTRTRLRVVIERSGYVVNNPDFSISQFCKEKKIPFVVASEGGKGLREVQFAHMFRL